MRYTVVWRTSAEADLARIWLSASLAKRARIRSACNAIDKALAIGPMHIGQSHAGETRIVIYRPLAVVIEVSEPDRTIRVLIVNELP